MTKTKISIRNIKSFIALIIAFFCFLIIIKQSSNIKNQMISALENCLYTIIPSLFSMLTISFFISQLNLPEKFEKAADSILNSLFGLSGNCLKTAFLGLTGGYNIAPKLSYKLKEKNIISIEHAKRLTMFFSSPGISFCINITGMSAYNSKSIGARLFFAGITADLIIAFIYNAFNKNQEIATPYHINNSVLNSFIQAVKNTSETIISICSWIILFSAIKTVLNESIKNSTLHAFIELFSEVSSAVFYSAKNFSVPVTAFSLYFGGFSVFLQQLPDVISLKINPIFFILIKIIRATTGTVLLIISDFIMPIKISVFNSAISTKLYKANPFGSLALVLLCLVFMANTKNTIEITQKSSESSLVLQY